MSAATNTELDQFMAELHGIAKAGLPLPEGLQMLAESLPPGRLQALSAHVSRALAAGGTLDAALASSPVKVPPALVALAKCAETSGNAPAVFEFALRHGRQIERQRDLLFTAILYPAILVMVIPLFLLFFAGYVTPQFRDIFQQLGAELPWLTQVILDVSQWQSQPVGFAMTLAVSVVMLLLVLIADRRERLLNALMQTWYFNRLTMLSDTAMSLQFAGMLLRHGTPTADAFAAAALAAGKDSARAALRAMSDVARQGQPVGPKLDPAMPPTAAAIFRAGERKGNLAAACISASEYCLERYERTGFRLTRSLEPLAILFLAGFVLSFVVAMYLPLFNIPRVVGR